MGMQRIAVYFVMLTQIPGHDQNTRKNVMHVCGRVTRPTVGPVPVMITTSHVTVQVHRYGTILSL